MAHLFLKIFIAITIVTTDSTICAKLNVISTYFIVFSPFSGIL